MQFIEGVHIPEEVLKAHSDGKLVLFVGAGASKSEPSSLPLFHELAQQLGELARVPLRKIHEDQIGTYIGSLPEGFDSHYHAASILNPEGSSPNDVHRAIARVAHCAGRPKIVTTNFDIHLSKAARELNLDLGDQWIGPALPLGRDFSGVVHLHGSLSRDHGELILDDRGFGRAYFGDGWAPRFLQPMFTENVVLFIGYSLTDTVMRYLTLGLPSRTPRYALIPEEEERTDELVRLQVTPITYPNSDGSYAELPRLLNAWADWKLMGNDDHKRRISELVEVWQTADPSDESRLPQLSILDEDYLDAQLKTVEGAKFFTERATTFRWLEWIERSPEYEQIFTSESELSEISQIFASWFATTYVSVPARSSAAMLALRRHRQRMHPSLVRMITYAIYELNDQDSFVAQKWRVILATSLHGHGAPLPLDGLFFVKDEGEYLAHTAVVRQALTPFLDLSSSYATFWQKDYDWPRTDVSWPLNVHEMKKYIGAWIDSEEVNASIKLNVLESGLLTAYELLDAYNGETRRGVLEWGRSAIEPHSQDDHVKPIDVIINGLRDIGIRMHGISSSLYDRWWETGYGLFRRLALHLVAHTRDLNADEKIKWVLDRQLLFDSLTKHELFQVLKVTTPLAAPATRELLLKTVLAGHLGDLEVSEWERTRTYEVYNLLVWLTRADSKWGQASEHLARMQAEYSDFAERANPDFSMWHGSVDWVPEPTLQVAEFSEQVEADPVGALNWFGNLVREGSRQSNDPYDEDYALLRGLANEHPKLGSAIWGVLDEAEVDMQRKSDIRRALVTGWTQAELHDVELEVLEMVKDLAEDETSIYTVTTFLLEQSRKRTDGPDTVFLESMRELAQSVWDRHQNTYEPFSDATPSDLALNSWPGDLVNFWIFQIQRRWREANDDWDGLNQQESHALEALLGGPKPALRAVWPAVGSEISFLDAADASFADRRILPLFSAQESARHVWEPFLFHPRVSPRLLNAGFLEAIADNFYSLRELALGNLEERFLSLAASVVNFTPIDVIDRQKILDAAVIVESGAQSAQFATEVVEQLRDDAARAQEIWERWLHSHIVNRLKGIPRNADKAELERWSDIVPVLGSSIPEAIALFQNRGLGLGSGRFSTECSKEALSSHGGELVRHYADRVRHSDPSEFLLAHRVGKLVQLVRETVGDDEAQLLVDAALEKGFLRQGA